MQDSSILAVLSSCRHCYSEGHPTGSVARHYQVQRNSLRQGTVPMSAMAQLPHGVRGRIAFSSAAWVWSLRRSARTSRSPACQAPRATSCGSWLETWLRTAHLARPMLSCCGGAGHLRTQYQFRRACFSSVPLDGSSHLCRALCNRCCSMAVSLDGYIRLGHSTLPLDAWRAAVPTCRICLPRWWTSTKCAASFKRHQLMPLLLQITPSWRCACWRIRPTARR
mmetsp:Transcript_93856/g.176415  ORF Transcript_93856/g.176415 Transcript_93856/m.176415 type:complete len:223 (-) Transcript_93856:853-1521(-)